MENFHLIQEGIMEQKLHLINKLLYLIMDKNKYNWNEYKENNNIDLIIQKYIYL